MMAAASRAGEAPDTAVEPGRYEAEVAGGEDRRQRDEEDVLLVVRPDPSTNSRYAIVNEAEISAKSTTTSTSRRGLSRILLSRTGLPSTTLSPSSMSVRKPAS